MEKNNARRYIYRCLRGDRSSGYVVVECLDPVYHGLDDYQLLAGGLMVLTRLLFGGPWHHFGFMGNRNVNWRKEHRRFHERMGHVSLEEKKAFIRRWMNGFNEEKE
jgi:hypothetical protein